MVEGARRPSELVLIEGATHVDFYDRDKYVELTEFFRKISHEHRAGADDKRRAHVCSDCDDDFGALVRSGTPEPRGSWSLSRGGTSHGNA